MVTRWSRSIPGAGRVRRPPATGKALPQGQGREEDRQPSPGSMHRSIGPTHAESGPARPPHVPRDSRGGQNLPRTSPPRHDLVSGKPMDPSYTPLRRDGWSRGARRELRREHPVRSRPKSIHRAGRVCRGSLQKRTPTRTSRPTSGRVWRELTCPWWQLRGGGVGRCQQDGAVTAMAVSRRALMKGDTSLTLETFLRGGSASRGDDAARSALRCSRSAHATRAGSTW
jgi:hypothetical protein